MAVKKRAAARKNMRSLPKEARPKSVAELKRKYDDLPLHFLFGVEKEIEHQCPSLDEYLTQLNEIKICLEKIRKCRSTKTAQIQAAKALHALMTLPTDIDETTRSNFEKLRESLNGWKQLAISAINETKHPENFLKI
ncbi:MAG: hypothetical protein AAFZ15_13480 [Bacteroidota bacterium]